MRARETWKMIHPAWLKPKRHFKAIFHLHERKYQSLGSRVCIFKDFDLREVALMYVSGWPTKAREKCNSGNRQTYFRWLLISALRKKLNLLIVVAIGETGIFLKSENEGLSFYRDSSINLATTTTKKQTLTIYYFLGWLMRSVLWPEVCMIRMMFKSYLF